MSQTETLTESYESLSHWGMFKAPATPAPRTISSHEIRTANIAYFEAMTFPHFKRRPCNEIA